MKICVIDNYDSFTYNLVHYLEEISDAEISTMMNDEIDWEKVENATHLVLSPGPGLPEESGDLMKVIEKYYESKKILGVCLGQQALGVYFGCKLKNLPEVKHGVEEKVLIQNHTSIFKNLDSEIDVGRYHSWVIESIAETDLEVLALDESGEIMAIQHKTLPIFGVQFHPESIMTINGKDILRNWIVL